MLSFLSLATLIASAAALGINCKGSGLCAGNTADIHEILNATKQLQTVGDGVHHYNEGVQIACSKGDLTSVCAFFQNGASGTADRAVELIQGLIDHGCKQCGSNPTNPGNDVSTGELTINAVKAPCCEHSGGCACAII